jgi:hypothetical protein
MQSFPHTMYPYRPHNNVRPCIVTPFERLRRCPDMMWQIRCTIRKVIGIEEWERIDEDDRSSYRDQEGYNRVARCIVAIPGEGRSQRMLLVKDGGFRCSIVDISTLPEGSQ